MPDVEWTTEELAALPAWTLVRASHAIQHGFYRIFAEHGLNPAQFGVLIELTVQPGLTQSELARRILVRPQSMGELIGTLVQRGLLERHGPGGRGRARPVTLTKAGRTLLRQASVSVREFNAPESLGLTANQARTLNTLLHKVIGTHGA